MCLIALALDAHPRYRLVIAANRDEFHHRPTAAAAPWEDAPWIVGGRDLLQHGGWLAVARDGRWAAVTNVRRPTPPPSDPPSRGRLVADYLLQSQTTQAFLATLEPQMAAYAGFNLLLGDASSAHYLSNAGTTPATALSAGVHTLSNASLDTPWPKSRKLAHALRTWCDLGATDPTPLFDSLHDAKVAADAELPDTGVGLSMERLLSPAFIVSARYGTRASTVLTVDHDGTVMLDEHRFGPAGVASGTSREQFQQQRL